MAETGIKDLFSTIKKSPALMITAVVFIGIVLYLVIKKGPGGAQTTTADTNTGLNTGSGSYIQPYIEPIVIQSGGGPTPQMAVSSGDGGAPSPTTGITMPPPSSGSPAGSGTTTNSSSGGGGFFGILGPNVGINVANKTYTNAQGKQVPLPIPSGAKVVQGSQNRVWYVYNNQQYLLTSGVGPPSAVAVYTPGAPFQPYNGSINQQNSQQQNVTNTTATTNSHG